SPCRAPRSPPSAVSTPTRWCARCSSAGTPVRSAATPGPARPSCTARPPCSSKSSAWTRCATSRPWPTSCPTPAWSTRWRRAWASPTSDVTEKLQKVLAAVGLGSRRACEELIADGRVTVDGEVAVLGRRIDPDAAHVEVDGVPVSVRPGLVYYLLNKPRGVVST